MAKPSSYELLKEIHEVTSNLETKLNRRITLVEKKANTTESKLDNMVGKAGIGIIILSTIIGTGITLMVDWFRGLRK